MSKLVIMTYDLSGAKRPQYEAINKDLESLDLRRNITKLSGKRISLPFNTVAGKFYGSSTKKLRDRLAKRVKRILRRHRLKGRVFIAVGGQWAWAKRV